MFVKACSKSFWSGLLIAAGLLAQSASAAPISYDEAVNGEISSFSELFAGSGLQLGFGLGTNTVAGTVTKFASGSFADDAFTFSVPTGMVVSNIAVSGSWNGQTGSWFWALRSSANGSGSNLGIDFVTDLKTNKDPFLGSLMPLTAGDYSMLIVSANGDAHSMDYTFSYEVSAVPVPAAVWLFGSGLVGLAGVARKKIKRV